MNISEAVPIPSSAGQSMFATPVRKGGAGLSQARIQTHIKSLFGVGQFAIFWHGHKHVGYFAAANCSNSAAKFALALPACLTSFAGSRFTGLPTIIIATMPMP